MFRPRIIPVLLLKNLGLVKSIKFKNYRYIGDPINAVKIFNDKKVDELVFLDITASKENRLIPLDFVYKVGDEANMPFGVGGGIRQLDDIRHILKLGAEKVILNTIAAENIEFVRYASEEFGSSTITVCVDIKKDIFGKYKVVYKGAKKKLKVPLNEYVQMLEYKGAGELIIQSVDRDGTFEGYDLQLIKYISDLVTIPVIALGGAKDYQDFRDAVEKSYASAVAAGSLFVYHGPRRAVLINYPSKEEMNNIFNYENTF